MTKSGEIHFFFITLIQIKNKHIKYVFETRRGERKMRELETVKAIAEQVSMLGGRTFYVGGYVRDKIMEKLNQDIDIEVYGITPEQLKNICKMFGRIDEVGQSFGIIKIHGIDVDISMPRTERSTGNGHRDFSVCVDPYMKTEEAAKRRDFTMNAIMQDVISGEYIDHYHGMDDLKNGVIRHINDETFMEDALRVFRAAQFAARFNFSVSEETVCLCRSIDVSSIPKERVFEETNKALLKAARPSKYFETLYDFGKLEEFFPYLERLKNVEQDPIHHPEGNVWNHTLCVLDNCAANRLQAEYPIGYMYAALFHDYGKLVATKYDETKKRWTSIGHAEQGLPIVKEALQRLTNEKKLKEYVLNMVSMHMEPHMMEKSSSYKKTNRMFDKSVSPTDMLLLAYGDTMGKKSEDIELFESGWWAERVHAYNQIILEPEVNGEDLIRLGYRPGPMFSDILSKCHDIHLAGVKREDVLKQVKNIIEGIHKRKESELT